MYDLTKWLSALHKDSGMKIKWEILPIETYREKYKKAYKYCDIPSIPIFYSKGVELGEMAGELKDSYIELNIENAGYKQRHEYLLTSIIRNNVNKDNLVLAFTSEFSNWGSKRIVIINEKTCKVLRNDFKSVYKLSWKDYTEGKYQKTEKTEPEHKVIKVRRPTLTPVEK